MPTFSYRGRDPQGALVTGEAEAESADELKKSLFEQGMVPLAVKEVRPGAISLNKIAALFTRVKAEELMIFTRQFHTLFRAGVSMDTIFATLSRQISNKPLKNAVTKIRADISSGVSLAKAFSRHPRVFNELYVSMLMAGEEAGILEQVLSELSRLIEREDETKRNIRSAMLYPKIVVVVLVGAIMFLMSFVVPKFAKFYAYHRAELPLPTQLLINLSEAVRDYWWVVLLIFALIYYAYYRYYHTKVGRLKVDSLKFKLPVFGDLNMKVANSRFGHILSALYRSGLSMPRSLDVTANVIGNEAFALEVRKVKDDIQKGVTLSDAMARQSLFPPVLIETTAVGERTGALDEMLSTIAEHYDLEIRHTIKNLTTLLEPVLLISIFSVVALLALAIFLPVWNISRAVTGR